MGLRKLTQAVTAHVPRRPTRTEIEVQHKERYFYEKFSSATPPFFNETFKFMFCNA